MLDSAATQQNIARKSHHADHVHLVGGKPAPSWIELNVTELCSRTCAFCPRHDPKIYPNQPLAMSPETASDLARQLHDISFRGTINISGFGEPLLHRGLEEVVSRLANFRVEIVTSGDSLTAARIRSLHAAGCRYFAISLYDGPEQRQKFEDMFANAGVDAYILRDRWQTEADNFGLSLLTNRAGTVEVGKQAEVDTKKPCYYLAYSMMIDWNGDILLCSQDWHKQIKFGTVRDGIMAAWTSPAMRKRRMQLLRGRDGLHPCSGCNASGTVHGLEHAIAWRS